MSEISAQQIKKLLENLDKLGPREQLDLLQSVEHYERIRRDTGARKDFLEYVTRVWPEFIPGAHHRIMADAFERVARGECTRLIINMAPRHTKSELTSWLLPSWFLGLFPTKKIIQASNTQDLASGFGRRVRNLINGDESPEFHEVFPSVELSKDSQAQNHWHTNHGGEYFAVGVNGRVTGKGGDIVIIDDPHSEQDAKQAERNPGIYDEVYNWYVTGPRQRLQPGAAIIVVMTRWSQRDLTGRLLSKQRDDESKVKDKWEVIELPAILDEGEPEERSMWPGFWDLETLQATRNELPIANWQAQYQQKPTSAAGAILKKEYWKKWEHPTPPACDFIIQSWDTAFTVQTRSDFSACTTWGVFKTEHPETGLTINNLILLDAFKGRWDFPTLKKKIKAEATGPRAPDTILVEAKGSGISLLQDLRMMGYPVEGNEVSRGTKAAPNDKIARANAIVGVFSSGYVWAPDRRFAERVIEECHAFPNGDNDDYVDSTTQAIKRFRDGGLIRTEDDWEEEENDRYNNFRRVAAYY